MTWLITTLIRAALTAALLVFVFDAPLWAGVLGFVVVTESATASKGFYR